MVLATLMTSGVVLVISSPGEAYARMEEAWMVSWQRQSVEGLVLAFLSSGDSDHITLLSPSVYRLELGDTLSLIPGILKKTVQAFAWARLNFPSAWVFRTNLSSYVDLRVLKTYMASLTGSASLGFSPTYDHLSGCGIGLTPEATHLVLTNQHALEFNLIDDVSISRLLTLLGCERQWTGRIDNVWPDGLIRHGTGPWYLVRVKGRDRIEDSRTLRSLAERGMSVAEGWFTRRPTDSLA